MKHNCNFELLKWKIREVMTRKEENINLHKKLVLESSNLCSNDILYWGVNNEICEALNEIIEFMDKLSNKDCSALCCGGEK